MRALLLIVPLLVLAGCSSGSSRESQDSETTVTRNQAAVTGTSGDPTVSVTFPLTPEQAAEAEAMAQHSAYLDSICATLPIDGSLAARRPNGTGCPRASAQANGAASGADVEEDTP